MKNTEIVKITDTTKIKRVVFKEPNLMAPDAEEQIKKEYYSLKETESLLYKARRKVNELEAEYNKKRNAYYKKSPLFDVEFETTEVEKEVNDGSTILIKNLGNDIIGVYNS